ncbi:hypothetical protein WICPIJ_006853 [Wickerhamomyces pijperi]|uniref:Ribosomal protein S2 n=2 Tax=Saccharomycotina TaxID=147537 RepID=A0A9P8TKM3_WICPI|nr:hypothetical protein WICPIJ_006853 [Wickerhamomyces pijperi]
MFSVRCLISRLLNSTTTTTQATETATTATEQVPESSSVSESLSSEDFFDNLHSEALKLQLKDEKFLDQQIYEILSGNTTTELTKRLSQNTELVQELKSFVDEFTTGLFQHKTRAINKSIGTSSKNSKFPNLEPSLPTENYTPQELFLRSEFLKTKFQNTGSYLNDVYIPHQEEFHPTPSSQLTISKLLASGVHLGHARSLFRSSMQKYIYGEYKGIHIIDLEQTLQHLKKASKLVEEVAAKGGIILYVGTRENQSRILQLAAERSQGYYVSSKWVSGTLTNSTEISKWERNEVDMGNNKTNRELTPTESRTIVKPDLIVVLNPIENRVLLKEAIQTRVPTIGIIDTDSEPSLVSYPIPANDDSLRSVSLILGVLSKSAEIGVKNRLANFTEYQKMKGVELLRDPALVLLRGEVQRVVAHGLELGEQGPQDLQVDVVSQVNPRHHEHDEAWHLDVPVEVVEVLGDGKEEVRDVHRDVNGQPHFGEVENIAGPDQKNRNNVMEHQLHEILSRLLNLQHQDTRLLRPEGSLHQVEDLVQVVVREVRIGEVHVGGVEVPQVRVVHDVKPERTREGVIHNGVALFKESVHLGEVPVLGQKVVGYWLQDDLHDEFSKEKEKDDVKSDKEQVLVPLPVLVCARDTVRNSDELMENVTLGVIPRGECLCYWIFNHCDVELANRKARKEYKEVLKHFIALVDVLTPNGSQSSLSIGIFSNPKHQCIVEVTAAGKYRVCVNTEHADLKRFSDFMLMLSLINFKELVEAGV